MFIICEKCGIQFDLSRRNIDSTVCKDCFDGDNYFLPDIQYPERKKFKEKRVELDTSNINNYDILLKVMEFERLLNSEIIEEAIQQNKYMAVVFKEFDINEAIHQLRNSKCFILKVSYFFTNDKHKAVPNYEDEGKQYDIVFCID